MHAVRRWLAATFAFAALVSSARAQTIEGQPIASQFGEYQVADAGNGFAFQPNQCNVIGAGNNFPAFTTGVPVKVWDPQPGFTEVSTAVTAFVNASGCAVSLAGLMHPHLASFYLTSGTGGLQEALNNSKAPSGITNTIILNARWYQLIAPRTAAQVISSVSGSAAFGLVDITTNPYTSYNWNGSQYVAVSVAGSGATFPSTGGLVYNTSVTASRSATSADVSGLITGATVNPANLNGTIYAAGINGAGVGVAQTAWSGSSAYPQCATVASGGLNYLAVAANTNVNPGTNPAIWWQVPNAGTPTNGDCGFYIAASQVSGTAGAELVLPPGNTNTCIGFLEPTVTSPGNPNVVIRGAGKSASTLTQTCNIISSGNAVVQQPDSGVAYALAGIDWEDFTVNANFKASAAMNVYGAQQFKIKHVQLENPADGSDHYIEFGHPSATNHTMAWAYEMDLEDIDTVDSHGPGRGANITASVSGGVPTFTVANGGSSYVAAYAQLILSGTGANADSPCTNRGTDTISVSGGVITSISTTATGCSSSLYASVFGGNAVTYCFKFNDASDSKNISALTPSECNTGVYNSNKTSLMSFTKTHPLATMTGILDQGSNSFFATQMDTVYRYGFDFEGATNIDNVYGSVFEWNGSNAVPGSSDYHFGTITNSPTNAPYAVNIFGDACGNAPSFSGYNHFLPASGTALPSFVHAYNSVSCDQTASNANAANYMGQNFALGKGTQLELFGATSGGAFLSASATGGTLNLGSPNATVDSSGNLAVASCAGCGSGSLPSAPAAGYAPVSTGSGNSYTAQAVSSQTYATSRQTYVLEDFLSAADGHGGTDYGYAASNFCSTVGCSTLLNPVTLRTTNPGVCKVYTPLNFVGPVQLDSSSCALVPQSTMSSSYVTLTGCSTTMGSTTVTCTSTSGLTAGMAIGGDITLGPENYIASVTNGTTFVLALPASRTFLAIPTLTSATLNGVDDVVDLATGQTVTGTGIPGSTTISSVSAGANTVTLSNNATVGALSPVDVNLASGTVVSGLTLNAITQKPVISFGPCSGCQTKGFVGVNYGASLTNVMIKDPAYASGNAGRTVLGVQGVQIYGEDNVNITNLQVEGIAGSALIWGGYVPASVPVNGQTVRESWIHGLYAYDTGDILTGQACFSMMTGLGNGNTVADEINTNTIESMHCVYSDAEMLVIGSYLHPNSTNGPRLITFDGENQAETGGSRQYAFSAADVVRILAGASTIHFNGGEFSTPGFGKATFHISNGAGLNITGADIAADGGLPETFNVGLTPGSTAVTYSSAATNAGPSFWAASHWNNIGVQINDGGTCAPCYMYLTNPAVNSSGTTATLASPYTGTATTGTITVAPGGYYFHVENTNTALLKVVGGVEIPSIPAVRTLLGLASDAAAWMVGSGALGGIADEVTDFASPVNGINQAWNVSNLVLLPSSGLSPGNTGSQIFQTTYQNGSNQYVPGGVRVYGSSNSGTTGTTYLNQTLLAGGADFVSTVNSASGSGNSYHQVTATGTNNAAYRVFNGAANWQWGLINGTATTFYLNDALNNAHAISFTQGNTPNVTLYGTLTVNSIATSPSSSPVCPNGAGGALTTSGCNTGSSGFPIILGSTSIAAGSTTTSVTGLNTTGSASSLSAASALPNLTTATTQTTGDSSKDVATDQFVTNSLALSNCSSYGGAATGAANALAISLPSCLGTPTLTQLTGVLLSFIPNLANTTTTPTLAVNGLTATTIVKGTTLALAAGDLATSTPASVIYNGTNFILQNPQVGISQTAAAGGFSTGLLTLSGNLSRGSTTNATTTYQGGIDGGSSATAGSGIFRGANNTSTGGSGSAILEPGAQTGGTGAQGFASIQQAFTVASALSSTFEVVSIATTADQVSASPLGSITAVGIAQTVGGTGAQLYVATSGKTTVRFDGTPVVGDLACAPPATTGTVGLAHDNGATSCPTGQSLGLVTGQVSGTGSGATATVLLQMGPVLNGVTSFNARLGAVSPATGDYAAAQVTNAAATNAAQTFTAAQTLSSAGSSSTPGISITGAPYSGGTATTNFPQLYLNQGAAVTTLSTTGTEFGINAPSGFTGHLINLFVNGGSTRFRVDYLGNQFVAGTATIASNLGLSSTAAPTIANGAAAGTSPGTPSVTGNSNTGVITILTGTATTANATLATITFSGTLGTIPQGCALTPRNAAATGANLFYTTAPTSTNFTVGVGGTAAAASTTYSWSYLCF